MVAQQHKSLRIALNLALVAAAVVLIGGVGFIGREFGFLHSARLSVLLTIPLLVAVRLRFRRPAVHARELVLLGVMICVTAVGSGFVVQNWYANGLHEDHAEDVRWADFERQFRLDPAFRNVQVHESLRKNIHWASGTVDSQADLARLEALAAKCGIEGRHLDGPFVHSVSLTVRGGQPVENLSETKSRIGS